MLFFGCPGSFHPIKQKLIVRPLPTPHLISSVHPSSPMPTTSAARLGREKEKEISPWFVSRVTLC